ncbi:MAG: hypothetical protein ACP5D9_09035 [Mariniphaga sp.]
MGIQSRFIFTGILLFFHIACFSQLKLPVLVSEDMVLQRNSEMKIGDVWVCPGSHKWTST